MADKFPLEDCFDWNSEEDFSSGFSPPSAEQAHEGELVVDGFPPATATVNHDSLGPLLPPLSMPPVVHHFQANMELNVPAIQLLQVPGVEDNAMVLQQNFNTNLDTSTLTIEGYNRPTALIVGHQMYMHPLQHLPLLPGVVHNQANVAPNIPQQDSQEGQQGPAAFVGGHHIHPLQHLPLLPGVGLNQANVQAYVALDPRQESLVGQQGRAEMVVGSLLPLPQWLNYQNICWDLQQFRPQPQPQPRPRVNYPAIRSQCQPQQADYDSSCVIKLGNVRMLKEKNRQGIGVFYLKGYRVCVRVYLNGDGIGRGTHLSVVLVLMRGEYDTLLQWPFRQQVTVTLQDQSGHGRHIAHTLGPLPTPPQPPTVINVASGAPQFAPLSVLTDDNYVSDDTLFLRIRLHQ